MNKPKIERPEIVEDIHLKYLDDLRISGVCNMWGSGAYLFSCFPVNPDEASIIVGYWMESFDERHPV